MRSIRVLLTCIGGRFGISTINALKASINPKITIIGSDTNNDIAAKYLVDAFYLVSPGSAPGYVQEMINICKKERVDVFIPCADEEVLSVAREKELFIKKGIKCAADDPETVDLVGDKWRLFNMLAKSGIPMPKFKLVNDINHIKAAAEYMGYPRNKFILKPRRSRGARNTWLIGKGDGETSVEEVQRNFKIQKTGKLNHVAMEFLPGPAYDVDLLVKNGRPIYIIPRRRVWRNKLSRFSEGCRVEKNGALTKMVSQIAMLLKLNYIYDFDCGSFGDHTPAIYEINPRFSGAVAAGMGAGINIPLTLVNILIDSKIVKKKVNFNISMLPITDMLFLNKEKAFLCR